MGTTVSVVSHRWVANQRVVTADVTFDGSYTSGGEPISAADFDDLGDIENVKIESGLTSSGLPVEYEPDTQELVVYDGTHTEQSAGAAAVDGEVVRLEVRGRS